MSPNLRQIEDWRTETVRLTAFPAAPVDPGSLPSWEDLVGEPPEERKEEPRGAGAIIEAGSFQRGVLHSAKDPFRLEWRYGVRPDISDDIPAMGSASQELDAFLPLARTWLASAPPMQRLAFGAVLLVPIANAEEGLRLLDGYLSSVQIDPKGSSDFLYRINRQREAKAGPAGLRINRLTKWSVVRFALASIMLSAGKATSQVEPPSYACRLELDINTVPEFKGELSPDALLGLFEELVDLGREIISKGDVP
ncbi:MAG: hypothetical protein ACYS0K_08895 [Planctomycetota bacterium]|jgi:hypothetical protein